MKEVDSTTLPSFNYVYVLSNPAMPGLVKIGRTSQGDVDTRLSQLYTTGVPFPFKVEFACRVSNCDEVERALHVAFSPNRVNAKREFFQIEPAQAVAILRLLHTEDRTEEFANRADVGIEQQEIAAGDNYRLRRPNMNFEEMGIAAGEQLVSSIDPDIKVVVAGPRKVTFQGQERYLTSVTKEVVGTTYAVAPGPYWSYKGQLLRDLYELTYPEVES